MQSTKKDIALVNLRLEYHLLNVVNIDKGHFYHVLVSAL